MDFSLDKSFQEQQFVLDTQRQIVKDFAKFNLFFGDYFESQPQSIEEIQILVEQHVAEIMKEGETRLLQLLYTIDLSEKEFLKTTTSPNFLKDLSLKIIRREAYKVYLRKTFR